MSELWSCVFLLFAGLVVRVSTLFSNDELFYGHKDADAKTFVSTTDVIWTVGTSDPSDQTPVCQVDKWQCNGPSHCQLTRSSYIDRRKVQQCFKVTFRASFTHRLNGWPQDILEIRNETDKLRRRETVMFLSRDSRCGVVYVYPGVQGGWVELRARNSAIQEKLDFNCTTYFLELIGDQARR
uniref:Putative lipocalin-3 1 n=1 Tax=Amblyomma cajennense TaxID=34607 RepID=A0A023FUW7_AMBCJ